MESEQYVSHGALPREDGVQFRVWAPNAREITLELQEREALPMEGVDGGYFECFVPGLGAGARYRYRLDDEDAFPDPASRFQPEGVHGPSEVVDPSAYSWQDEDWTGISQEALVFYELHVGTFTEEGTFRAAAERLEHLRDLGVTAVELMPVADFPGRWNWGYDQAALFAPSRVYGSPDELRAFVDRAHALGMAVYLDVIYNHLGPDGAYVAVFAPMFTERHETPWGAAINLDDEHSDGVRRFFIDNALHWLREYHVDGLRLDATHALIDDSEPHFLAELAEAVHALDDGGPPRRLIAEDERNLNTIVRPREKGGYGLDGVWVDDFHHQVRHVTAGDRQGYFADFVGTSAADLAATMDRGWYFTGQHSSFLGEPRGTDPAELRREQCVFCIQNHDQVGNRPAGTRLTDDVPLHVYRAVSALLLFAPQLPLLFMGQEWAASTPFQFFTDHNDELGRQVSAGRREEFEDFEGFEGDVPDPQDPATFRRSTLDWHESEEPEHVHTLALYRDLLTLRKELAGALEVTPHGEAALVLRRGVHHLLVNWDGTTAMPLPGNADVVLHTEEADYTPDGRPPSHEDGRVLFQRAGALVATQRAET